VSRVISISFLKRSQLVGGLLSIALHGLLVAWLTLTVKPVSGPTELDGAVAEAQVVSLIEDEPTAPPVTAVMVGPPAPAHPPRHVRTQSHHHQQVPVVAAPVEEPAAEEDLAEESPPAVPAPPTEERWVPPGEARDLRVYDVYPTMPHSMWQGRRYAVAVDICVSDHGSVSDVTVRGGAAPAMDSVLRDAVQTWRYRPRLVAGRAVPFCHEMNIFYSQN
jgi:hypothetical protein